MYYCDGCSVSCHFQHYFSYIMKVKCTMYQKKNIIINVYRFTLQELSTRIEEYDALKKSTLFQSMHKIIYDIKYYVYLKF